jgi:hypothetical protein
MRKTILATVFGLALASAGTGMIGCGDDDNGGTGGAGGTAGADAAAGTGGTGGTAGTGGTSGTGGADAAAGMGGADAAAGTGGGGAGGSNDDGGAPDGGSVMAKPMDDMCNAGATTDHERIINSCTPYMGFDKPNVMFPGGYMKGQPLPTL